MIEALQQRESGKLVVVHQPTMLMLLLRLNEAERAARSTPSQSYDEWHIPGGSVEDIDRSAARPREAAAVRETREETGLLVDRDTILLGTASWQAYYEGEPASFEADFFVGTVGGDLPEPPQVTLSAESSESAWVSAHDLNDFIGRGLTAEAHAYGLAGLQKIGALGG